MYPEDRMAASPKNPGHDCTRIFVPYHVLEYLNRCVSGLKIHITDTKVEWLEESAMYWQNTVVSDEESEECQLPYAALDPFQGPLRKHQFTIWRQIKRWRQPSIGQCACWIKEQITW